MDIIQLYQDFGIQFVTEGHHHARPGWVNVGCPFCTGNPGYHLGFETEGEYFYCWRCGWHPMLQTIAAILHFSTREAHDLLRQYGVHLKTKKTQKTGLKTCEHRLPTHTAPLQSAHRRYLESRNFDPDVIARTWNVVGTGPVSTLDRINFSHRIVIPIIWDEQEVSFTTRDVTGKSQLRYITCPKSRELIPHKNIIYGKQSSWDDVGVCVEGPTDVWRMGEQAFCTFGIAYTHYQVKLISHLFKKVVVIFDDDPQAIGQAKKLVAELRFRGVDASHIVITGDPAGMSQNEADLLMSSVIS